LKEHAAEISNIDSSAVENLCRQVISENLHAVNEYKAGKEESLNFLMGQVMRHSQRRARPEEVREKLKEILSK
jgi:aspartyl-tRNA(Asn)/glutamyl-tRNA(Gln) amidotransferase subunit B